METIAVTLKQGEQMVQHLDVWKKGGNLMVEDPIEEFREKPAQIT